MSISQYSHHIQSLTSLCHRVDLEQASENFFLHVFSERGWFFSTKLIIYPSQSFPTHSEVEPLSGSHQSHPWPPLPICGRESWTVTTKIQKNYLGMNEPKDTKYFIYIYVKKAAIFTNSAISQIQEQKIAVAKLHLIICLWQVLYLYHPSARPFAFILISCHLLFLYFDQIWILSAPPFPLFC